MRAEAPHVLPVLQYRQQGSHLEEVRSLLEDPSCSGCYGLMAFVTVEGLLLMGMEAGGPLSTFLQRGGKLDLVVGVDAITTAEALRQLARLEAEGRGRVRTRAYKGPEIFHPKLLVFERKDGTATVIVGSSNLTRGGLLRNVELSARVECTADEAGEWLARVGLIRDDTSCVHQITPSLIEEVASRAALEASRRRTGVPPPTGGEVQAEGAQREPDRVLVQFVPKAGDRWSQVGFALETVRAFFGMAPDGTSGVLLQNLQPGCPPGQVEQRRLVRSRVNKNSRIEIGGLKGRHYPSNAAPLLLFQEVGERRFRYLVLMPGEDGYAEVAKLAGPVAPGRAMPAVIVEADAVRAAWRGYPA